MSYVIEGDFYKRLCEAFDKMARAATDVHQFLVSSVAVPPPPLPTGYRCLRVGEVCPANYMYVWGRGTASPHWLHSLLLPSSVVVRITPELEGYVAVPYSTDTDPHARSGNRRSGVERRYHEELSFASSFFSVPRGYYLLPKGSLLKDGDLVGRSNAVGGTIWLLDLAFLPGQTVGNTPYVRADRRSFVRRTRPDRRTNKETNNG
jgi:hypothetical protein